jgi:NADP-dependent 3-hydroxy acid dehydrogenase YdfG
MATTGVAVVTGAGSGLGRSIARSLLASGWQVGAAGRREDALHETLAATAPAQSGLAVATDVTVPESVAGLFDAVHHRWGRIDLLVKAFLCAQHAAADEGPDPALRPDHQQRLDIRACAAPAQHRLHRH